eukprot:gene27411-33780_t
MDKKDLQNLIEKQQLEICPFAYMRGRTFRKSYIIADEMQNASVNQIKTLLSRLDENSKLVMTGDLDQCDISENGLEDLLYRLEKCDNKNDYYHIEQFTIKDVKRNDPVEDMEDDSMDDPVEDMEDDSMDDPVEDDPTGDSVEDTTTDLTDDPDPTSASDTNK